MDVVLDIQSASTPYRGWNDAPCLPILTEVESVDNLCFDECQLFCQLLDIQTRTPHASVRIHGLREVDSVEFCNDCAKFTPDSSSELIDDALKILMYGLWELVRRTAGHNERVQTWILG